MINNEYRAEYKHNGKKIIIDLALLPGYENKFEVIAMYANSFIDFDLVSANNIEDAIEDICF